MKIRLKSTIHPELKATGLKEGDEIEVRKDPVSKVGGCSFTWHKNGYPYDCSIWPEDFEIIEP